MEDLILRRTWTVWWRVTEVTSTVIYSTVKDTCNAVIRQTYFSKTKWKTLKVLWSEELSCQTNDLYKKLLMKNFQNKIIRMKISFLKFVCLVKRKFSSSVFQTYVLNRYWRLFSLPWTTVFLTHCGAQTYQKEIWNPRGVSTTAQLGTSEYYL